MYQTWEDSHFREENRHNYYLVQKPEWAGSSVGIATGYVLDYKGIESRWGRHFPHLSRPVLGPTQPPVQWVTGSLPGVKSGRGVTLTHYPFLVPWARKSTAIPVLPLWAVRPVQSLSACTRVHFTFTLQNPEPLVDTCKQLQYFTRSMSVYPVIN